MARADDEPAEAESAGSTKRRAVFELTALVAHILDDTEEQERPKKKRDRGEPEKAEGHIIAHIKVKATMPLLDIFVSHLLHCRTCSTVSACLSS